MRKPQANISLGLNFEHNNPDYVIAKNIDTSENDLRVVVAVTAKFRSKKTRDRIKASHNLLFNVGFIFT